jgi:plastocyanin
MISGRTLASRPVGFTVGLCALLVATPIILSAQSVNVTARVEVTKNSARVKLPEQSTIVVWLQPVDGAPAHVLSSPQAKPSLTQKNKSFEPHLLVVQVGTVVEFPNHDPFFHNVFSLFNGKRFDLGLYEAGTTRQVRFDRPGVCYIFCNIHSEMSAVVVVLDTPYYAIANAAGGVSIPDVPTGRYTMHVWDERSLPETLAKLTREVTVSESQHTLAAIRISETNMPVAHKNKYGRDYDKPVPSSPVYIQP